MPICLNPQSVFVSSTSKGQNSLQVTVYVPAPLQPPSVTLQSCNYVLVNGSEASALQQFAMPYDPVLGAALWSFALVFVLGSWLVANNAGMILSAIKRW